MPRFATPDSELPRDRWKRPLITPPDGGDAVPYTRTTTWAGTLDDTTNLTKWKMRNVAVGVALSKSLALGAVAASTDLSDDPSNSSAKRTLDDIADRAIEVSNGSAAATTGTAIHTFTERVDRGLDLDRVPEEYHPDLEAYRRVLALNSITPVAIEGFCVYDTLQIGGTYDRILRLPAGLLTPDGRDLGADGVDVIGDVKTGNVDFGMGKIAMQLATYANSVDYDHRDGSRRPLGTYAALPAFAGDLHPVSPDWAIVIHLPAGTGTASLLWVDLTPAVAALELAGDVREYRRISRRLSSRFATVHTETPPPPSLAEQLRAAPSLDALRGVYLANAADWTPGLTALAADISRDKGWAA